MAWLQFPVGTESLTIDRQIFAPEVEDKEGGKFGRVPDHFVEAVMSLCLGYKILPGSPTGVDLPDLPKQDPARDTALSQQALRIQNLDEQVKELTTDLNTACAEVTALRYERDQLKLALHEATQKAEDAAMRIEELEEQVGKVPTKVSTK